MPILISVPQAKKSSNADIIATMKKLSEILSERELNDPNFDTSQVIQTILGDNRMNNPDEIRAPFIVTDSIIAIPSVMPKKKSDGTAKNGTKHVVPLVQVPGKEPYYAWIEDTDTFVESDSVNLRGGRSASLHSVIPGMIVSFHHYSQEDGMKERYRIDAVRMVYDENGQLSLEILSEADALFAMPDTRAGRKDF